ncbi:hypothetical protein B9Z55_021168 [Caenorhabditis nigoni]|nr:hypothetical protein B9Z55_021168 [Caenorhabditis nigoni]
MDDTVIKEEVIEEDFNFTFKNGEYVEVKQEEIKQKPEYLLEKDIKMEAEEIDSKVEKGKLWKLRSSFIRRNKYLMKDSKYRRRTCQICHMAKESSEVYRISSKGTRIVLMVGCILRGTHSVEQAMLYITNTTGVTCYSHCKESVNRVFECFGIKNIQGVSMFSTQAKDKLLDIVKKIDSNFTINQFIDAFNRLSVKSQKCPSSF